MITESLEQKLFGELNRPEETVVVFSGERKIVKNIKRLTAAANQNNRTRTEAYWRIYEKNPEIHWAFLAHMVSRNGGWQMTDLKGGLMNELFSKSEKESFFHFLECANAAIFADAYPQLLLYDESKKNKLDLNKLLRLFHVSRFMGPVWEQFYKAQDSAMITAAMIINEQRMLEDRLFTFSTYKKVVERIDFRIQDFLGWTTVFFPYKRIKEGMHTIAGLPVTGFADSASRITLGKSLYSMLFQNSDVLQGAKQFAKNVPHTGSRADYWAAIFTKMKDEAAIHSPVLEDAWNDIPQQRLPLTDWFKSGEQLNELKKLSYMKKKDCTKQVKKNVKRLFLLNQAKAIL